MFCPDPLKIPANNAAGKLDETKEKEELHRLILPSHDKKTKRTSRTSALLCSGLVVFIFALIGVVIFQFHKWSSITFFGTPEVSYIHSSAQCSFELVESIPENLTYVGGSVHHKSTFEGWSSLLNEAVERVDLAVFYWTLTSQDVKNGSQFPSAWQGEQLFKQLMDTGLNRNVKIRIAQNAATKRSPQWNSKALHEAGAAEVRNVDIAALVGGVLHTKMWLVDDDKLYVGSANMDFRALTQVKELGVVIRNCPHLVQDMRKIFEEYWSVGGTDSIPKTWPPQFSTNINLQHPLSVMFNNHGSQAFISSSPPPFTATGRTDDVDAIVAVIDDARVSVDVAVMDYFPRMLYSSSPQYWPVLDTALRRAAVERGVRVRLLASHWAHSRADLGRWLQSLADISGAYPHITIETKLFFVPAYTKEQRDIPFGRVNHNKYLVTDRIAYIGTSNWSGDYFTNTGGVGLIVNETLTLNNSADSLRTQLQAIFDRDWNSKHAKPVHYNL